MAGHSKWMQIKHKKAITDAKRGRVFSKLAREVTVAAKTGGANPDANPRLRTAMERAKNGGLPKDNIERALKRAAGSGLGEDLFEFLYEASAPGGVAILIEGITDNKNRTTAELKHVLGEHGGRMAESGSLLWNFEKRGTLALHETEQSRTKETVELAIIDAGARDFFYRDGMWSLETDFGKREMVRRNLDEAGIKVKETGHDYVPQSTLNLSENQKENMIKLLEAITEHDDVQEIYTNINPASLKSYDASWH